MDLSEQDLKKIKSLHVMLKMPIWILERETNRVCAPRQGRVV